MTRRHISTKLRVIVFERAGGRCSICRLKIDAGQDWDLSHDIPLALGGADDETNWSPAHRRCHRTITREEDMPRIAKAKRSQAVHIGAKRSKNPMPGGKRSSWRKRMNGTVERREG